MILVVSCKTCTHYSSAPKAKKKGKTCSCPQNIASITQEAIHVVLVMRTDLMKSSLLNMLPHAPVMNETASQDRTSSNNSEREGSGKTKRH